MIDIEDFSDQQKHLLREWARGHFPTADDVRGLTPDEARALAYAAGYDGNWWLHAAVRDGLTSMARAKSSSEQ